MTKKDEIKFNIEAERLSALEAAAYLQLSHRTLAKWRCIGTPFIPYLKIRGRIFYLRSALDAWMQKNTVVIGGQGGN